MGHDHSNDFVADFEGILLGYGRKTGYGCYGPPRGYWVWWKRHVACSAEDVS